ncbi:acyl-CoA dehydrogenase family protein [Salinisphaera sp. P385]|uniref:Acyl-CoA dehydrogenase family protein n=1 Tax=Spectribacter acetivorans TaxID=3075603 RepID=A0ABU3BAN0_9GAMM|nr:acyl-CoA dehydrogenase family protein [Salinisphaera sp. P385]MDT0619493.1 acyl-CoA dehydrogenase family protein [Salinisphaera sp. P385]
MHAAAESANPELDLFRDTVRRYAENELAPQYAAWEEAEHIPREIWNQLGESGLLCVDMPEEYGGGGGDFAMSAVIVEELSRQGLTGLATGVTVHSDIVAPYVLHMGTEEQKQAWLPRLASGDAIGAIAMTEPGAGSDLQGMRSQAVADGEDWILNGAKTFITNGGQADLVIVAARTEPGGGARGTSLFLVDTSLDGFRRGRNLEKIGQHAGDTAELFFDDLRLPGNALLGARNGGFGHLIDELPRERLALAIGAIGAAEGALAITIDYVNERKAFGQPIGSFQNTRFSLAEMQTDIQLNRAFMEKCLAKFEAGTMDVTDAAMVKYAATEMQCRVADGCLQLFGGYGYMREYPIARAFVDARVQRIYGGTSEIMKELIARSLVGK